MALNPCQGVAGNDFTFGSFCSKISVPHVRYYQRVLLKASSLMFKILPCLLILVEIPCQDLQRLPLTCPLHNPTLRTVQNYLHVKHVLPSHLCGPTTVLMLLLPKWLPSCLPGQFHSTQPETSICLSSL